ncbi:hypothetical protein KZA77_002265 [Streptococcus constellatus]|uniref:hypothetical protein n=2 Tax=Streptococcus TaxID=1301 RepID=UPI001C56BF3E|nr:hypothetical protein [Streptococcus constellatus]MBW3451967.1 hypothetical protein [Streptococcus constellatus]MDK6972655.1 hypothetical protein [Streptococcus constellatus]
MDEDIAYQILNKHQNQYYSEDGQFVVEYTYFPIGRRGKEFLDAFNLIFGQHGKTVTFNDIEYKVVNGRYGFYDGGVIDSFLSVHYARAYLKEPTQVRVSAGEVTVSANQVTIYSDSIAQIKAERFMYADELNNTQLLNVLNQILEELEAEKGPSDENLKFLKNVARSTSELAGFAANIITILSPFL